MDPSRVQRYLQDPDGPLVVGQTWTRNQGPPSAFDSNRRFDSYSPSYYPKTSIQSPPPTRQISSSSSSTSASDNSAGAASVFSQNNSRKSSFSSRTTTVVSGPARSTLTGHLLERDLDALSLGVDNLLDLDRDADDDFNPNSDGSYQTTARNTGLPCLLRDTNGCPITFSLSSNSNAIDNWVQHSISHFGLRSPPNHSLCIFCDRVFDSEPEDSITSWTERMEHIAFDHLLRGQRLERSRPDFWTLRILSERGGISKADYEWALGGDERPKINRERRGRGRMMAEEIGIGEEAEIEEEVVLRPLGYVPPERREEREKERKSENEVKVVVDPRREQRQRQRSGKGKSSAGSGSKSHSSHHHRRSDR